MHRLRNAYRVGCRALSCMVCSHVAIQRFVFDKDEVVKRVHNFNASVNDWQRRRFVAHIFNEKRDIDVFFNNVPRHLIHQSWGWKSGTGRW